MTHRADIPRYGKVRIFSGPVDEYIHMVLAGAFFAHVGWAVLAAVHLSVLQALTPALGACLIAWLFDHQRREDYEKRTKAALYHLIEEEP